ncbi:tRNA nucleotidyltransferase cca2-like [Zingiber officinale]|uniref:tRNA nucleotidyltransferase cca2-like n=1 Tax=Zingiber officinale TaxID=94328 RepID=UPI001C4D58D3|nr:tRNA nucleotidyltransferase cca2-like [Zingiber officinale]
MPSPMAFHLKPTRLFACRLFRFPPLRAPPSQIPLLSSPNRALGLRLRLLHSGATARGGSGMGSSVAVKDKIDLTEKEEKIFRRLLDVVDRFNLETQLRVAGGWVRDKLLGKDCYDIDIALDNMLGREFCEKVNEFLQSTGEEQQGIGVIQCNPDQSKHLETARMRIYDTWVDFVNLRSETYAENSRIPTMKFGTAREDAFRRDLTINSLFYNINTNSVEDLTGRGVQDLRNGYVVTPLPPKATFLDDPLRVLRAIRFGARFEFSLDEDLKKAAMDSEVKAAIAEKISRERIGHEIDLMISDKQPVTAITNIVDLQLFFVVFTLPANVNPAVNEEIDSVAVSYLGAAWNLLQSIGCSILSDDQRRLYLYEALFFPFRNVVYMDKKSKKIPVTNFIIRESLKLKASDADMVMSLHFASERFLSLIPLLNPNNDSEFIESELDGDFLDVPMASKRRILAGLLLRQIKDYWRVSLLASTLLYNRVDSSDDASSIQFELDTAKEIFLRVQSAISQLDLDQVWDAKPLLDGKAIMNFLQLKTGGPLVKEWQNRVLKWQLAHPQGTADECLDWMKQSQTKRAKLGSCT